MEQMNTEKFGLLYVTFIRLKQAETEPTVDILYQHTSKESEDEEYGSDAE
ncbi:MAG: hypothetical protein IJ079_00880 [Lachnospiraceae bacterium]|nr:hypothetical protein [Lachnospiraceae bacterium]